MVLWKVSFWIVKLIPLEFSRWNQKHMLFTVPFVTDVRKTSPVHSYIEVIWVMFRTSCLNINNKQLGEVWPQYRKFDLSASSYIIYKLLVSNNLKKIKNSSFMLLPISLQCGFSSMSFFNWWMMVIFLLL